MSPPDPRPGPHVLVVDLNNFARYPTLSVGYLAAVCRAAGMAVEVFSPLMIGLKGFRREPPPGWWGLAAERLNYLAATSRLAPVRRLRAALVSRIASDLVHDGGALVEAFRRRLARARPDVVLVSTYLMYREQVAGICAACRSVGVPVLVGGPYFAQPPIVEAWAGLPGLTALIAGEVELELPALIEALLAGRELGGFQGVVAVSGTRPAAARARPPLRRLDAVPFPDFRDFPWERYPNRIVPVITGRGCGWGVCTFCSDVVSTAGRTFRSRSPGHVLEEIGRHHRDGTSLFVFTDLKLNSDLEVWQALLDGMQAVAPGARWVAAVHVDAMAAHRPDNGLEGDALRRAAASGCVRLSTGLESGSQRVLDAMKKGTRIEATGRFLAAAAAAGISTRCTMILGYPTETAQDVAATVGFLEAYRATIERIKIGRFFIAHGTAFEHSLARAPAAYPRLRRLGEDAALGWIEHSFAPADRAAYRAAVLRLLGVIHRINRNPLRPAARDFEGVM